MTRTRFTGVATGAAGAVCATRRGSVEAASDLPSGTGPSATRATSARAVARPRGSTLTGDEYRPTRATRHRRARHASRGPAEDVAAVLRRPLTSRLRKAQHGDEGRQDGAERGLAHQPPQRPPSANTPVAKSNASHLRSLA